MIRSRTTSPAIKKFTTTAIKKVMTAPASRPRQTTSKPSTPAKTVPLPAGIDPNSNLGKILSKVPTTTEPPPPAPYITRPLTESQKTSTPTTPTSTVMGPPVPTPAQKRIQYISSIKQRIITQRQQVSEPRPSTTSQYVQAAYERKQEIQKVSDTVHQMQRDINPRQFYNITLPSGQTKKVLGIQYMMMLNKDLKQIDRARDASSKIYSQVVSGSKDWHPDTKVTEYDPFYMHINEKDKLVKGKTEGTTSGGEKAYHVKFPYAGAEYYRHYLREGGLEGGPSGKGLATATTMAFTAEDPLGAISTYHALTGDKQAYLDTKVKALHKTKEYTKEGLLGFGKLWISMPVTQVALAYVGGGALGTVTKVAPKIALGAKVGLGLYAAPGMIASGQKTYGHIQKGQWGEVVGAVARTAPVLYAGYKGYKSGTSYGRGIARSLQEKSWIKLDTQRAKYSSLTKQIKQAGISKTVTKTKLTHLKELKPEHFKAKPDYQKGEWGPKELDTISKSILKGQRKYGLQLGGSAGQKLQLKYSRAVGDIDVSSLRKTIPRPKLYKTFEPSETLGTRIHKWTGLGKKGYKVTIKKRTRVGWTRDASTKFKAKLIKDLELKPTWIKEGGKWKLVEPSKQLKHKVDIHVRGKPGEFIRPGAKFLSSKKLGKFKVMDVREQAMRKGTSWKDIEHKGRGKDIGDFLNIRKEQLLTAKAKGVDISAEWTEYKALVKWAPKTMTGAEGKEALPKDILSAFYEQHPSKAPSLPRTRFQTYYQKHSEPPKFTLEPPYSPELLPAYKPKLIPSAWQEAMGKIKPGWWEKYFGKGYTPKEPKYTYEVKSTGVGGKSEYWRTPTPKSTTPTGYGYTQPAIIPSYTTPLTTAKIYPTPVVSKTYTTPPIEPSYTTPPYTTGEPLPSYKPPSTKPPYTPSTPKPFYPVSKPPPSPPPYVSPSKPYKPTTPYTKPYVPPYQEPYPPPYPPSYKPSAPPPYPPSTGYPYTEAHRPIAPKIIIKTKPKKTEKELTEGYDILVKRDATKKARYVKATKQPLPTMRQALGAGALATDKTVSRTFKVVKAKGKPKPQPRFDQAWNQLGHKYRKPIRKGHQIKSERWIEKTTHAIDSKGELEGITFKGVAQLKKMKAAGIPIRKRKKFKPYRGF